MTDRRRGCCTIFVYLSSFCAFQTNETKHSRNAWLSTCKSASSGGELRSSVINGNILFKDSLHGSRLQTFGKWKHIFGGDILRLTKFSTEVDGISVRLTASSLLEQNIIPVMFFKN